MPVFFLRAGVVPPTGASCRKLPIRTGSVTPRWFRRFPKSTYLLLSCSMDTRINIWEIYNDRRLRQAVSRKIPFCVKFDSDYHKQLLFVAGIFAKKMVCWDTRSGDIVQEYDRHLGLVNFVNGNRRFVTTSDDKSLHCECPQ
ncbi:pre-mRNA splicing factor [Culex quinquefasciatus]|uniref:Pre-mRNA splicing factor n=1 Tax=Culex quinquefasciatus TaxID=7176 RepID=B0XLB5_CULQU|nr:pre-mRNA splicing factor [Culex quinquefasciatus]|eukprot:XP_001870437.1 pre-mRNA splicing factor [Culex quinquefasciatus]